MIHFKNEDEKKLWSDNMRFIPARAPVSMRAEMADEVVLALRKRMEPEPVVTARGWGLFVMGPYSEEFIRSCDHPGVFPSAEKAMAAVANARTSLTYEARPV